VEFASFAYLTLTLSHNDDLTGHVPNGDVLVHAGDMTDDGTAEELEKALGWIRNLPHKLKVIIPGEMQFLPPFISQSSLLYPIIVVQEITT
jgi:3',5'-cyclic AMP phosphodiesterase CpdA